MPQDDLSPIALALGRVPTGLYVVSAIADSGPIGFVGSFVMQVGFEPPTLCVAVGKDRAPLEAIRAGGRFALSILDEESSNLMGAFFRKYEGGETPFDHVEHVSAPDSGPPVLTDALAWLSCKLTGEHPTGDHVVVFGEVTHAKCCRSADPSVHIRNNGLAY